MSEAPRKFATFAEFYAFYLGEHSNRLCRRLHFIGTTLAAGSIALALVSANPWWLLAGLVCGYAFAWAGHAFFEKNRPATFTYPLRSFAADWVMWREMLGGKLSF